MKITVYLGANEGNDPALKTAVQELGKWIGKSGNTLVYGGSKTGLMGELATVRLQQAEECSELKPSALWTRTCSMKPDDASCDAHHGGAKAKMIELGDAFLAFPGGTGTAGGNRGGHVKGILKAA